MRPFLLVCIGSVFKESAECRSDLRDHVGSGGGAAKLLEGLVAALPCEGARTKGSHEERVETICFLRSSVECPLHQDTQESRQEVTLPTTSAVTAL